MFFQHKQCHNFTLVFWLITLNIPSSMSFLLVIDIFYLSGEPISPHLLRCSAFAVRDHSFMRCALHLGQSRLVNNPG